MEMQTHGIGLHSAAGRGERNRQQDRVPVSISIYRSLRPPDPGRQGTSRNLKVPQPLTGYLAYMIMHRTCP